MHDDLGGKGEENELEQAQGEPEACPVMSVLQHLQGVTIEVNITIKVHVVEGLHGNLAVPSVLDLILFFLECEVVLDRATWQSNFVVLARTHG